MKKVFVLSAICAITLAVSCQPKEAIETVDQNSQYASSVIHTFTCEFAQPDSKFAVASDGKTSWEVGDEIMLHGGTDGASRLKITLAAEDISADGKQATISFSEDDLAPYARPDAGVVSQYYAQYPASCVPTGNMYYECCFTNTNNILMAACDVDNSFVFYNLCGILSYTVSGDFDKVVFFGNNGETIGYDYYQVRIRNDNSGMVVDYHKPGNGFSTYKEQNIIEDNSVKVDGSTINYLCFPKGANFTNGFTFIFYKDGVAQKTVSTKSSVNLARNDFFPVGSITSHLKDYKPTYTVVGEETEVFGSKWNTFAAANVMTDNGDGTYSITYNVPAGTYHFKIVQDHSYDFGQWPYDHNQEYVANVPGALTIIFTPATNTISFAPFVEAATYTVAGTENLFGTSWDATNTANDMTLQADGTYVWSKEVTSAMDIEFKIVKNHNWGTVGIDNWPVDDNETYSIPAAGTMYIYFNPANKDITKVFYPKITIDGVYSEWSSISGTETPDAICKVMKATSDLNNYYFYLVSDATKRALTEVYTVNDGYYYLDFDLDNNPETGDKKDGSNGFFEALTYIRLFSSDGTTITINNSPYVSTSNGVSSSGVEAKGSVAEGLMYFEIKIPRANLPAVSSGQTIRILSWRSKGVSILEYTFNVA